MTGVLKEEWEAEYYDIIMDLFHYIRDNHIYPGFISTWEMGKLMECLHDYAGVSKQVLKGGFYPGTRISVSMYQPQLRLVNLLAGYAVYGNALSPGWEKDHVVFGKYSREIWERSAAYHRSGK